MPLIFFPTQALFLHQKKYVLPRTIIFVPSIHMECNTETTSIEKKIKSSLIFSSMHELLKWVNHAQHSTNKLLICIPNCQGNQALS